MPPSSIAHGPYIKGVVASNQPYAQPKGSVPRASNFVMTNRGALTPTDGSQLVHAFNGAVQSGRGKVMADFLFSPVGVSRYYLSLIKALDIPLGRPMNLTAADGGAGGTLTPGTTYYYKVTAIDKAGGETTPSNEANFVEPGASHKVTLTWNIVPNAVAYNVYRSTATGTETQLFGANLPVAQLPAGNLTITFTDDGTDSSALSFNLISGAVTAVLAGPILVASFTLNSTTGIQAGTIFNAVGTSPAAFNNTWTVTSVVSPTVVIARHFGSLAGVGLGSTCSGGTFSGTGGSPPGADTTQQTALFQMPAIAGTPAMLPVSYNNSNIVALFPADLLLYEGGGGGGSGGGGGTGGGGSGGGGSGGGSGSSPTPSGGVPGNVTTLPQFKQFTNRAIIALGNGFPPQIFSDATGTLINPATIAPISAISVDAFGVVTVTTSIPHGIPTAAVGGNVLIAGVTNGLYNMVGPTINIISTTQYQVRNLAAIGQAGSSGGTSTTTSLPLISTYVPAFPKWTASTPYIVGDIIVPATQPSTAIFLTCTQSGNSGTVEPTWPTTGAAAIGQQVAETGAPAGTAGVQWTVTNVLNTAAPPPAAAAHIEVYSGALWVLNTATTNTSNGLDGPTSIRMSSIGNPNSWNPINQAFLDKDDGFEGTGMAKFTITAQGIPPEGSLVAFKNVQGYQLIGVFGASNFSIQAISSDMGCTASRTLQFVPGFGIARYTHLGVAVFNGVQDSLISEQLRPYLFPTNDSVFSDITVVDSSFVAASWAAQTANPPQYVIAAPIGNSGGQLTRLFCYDLVLKAWVIVDLPWAISTMSQFKTTTANPVTILGGFSDGVLSRWQAGDLQWDVGATGARSPSNVTVSMRTLTAASQDNDQNVYARRVVFTLINSGVAGVVTVTPFRNGVAQQPMTFYVPANQDFDIDAAVGLRGKRFDATISYSIHADLAGDTWEIEPRPAGVLVGV